MNNQPVVSEEFYKKIKGVLGIKRRVTDLTLTVKCQDIVRINIIYIATADECEGVLTGSDYH